MENKLFKIGDRVIRKEEYRDILGWNLKDKILMINKITPLAIYFSEDPNGVGWDAEKFDLHESKKITLGELV